MSSNSNDKISGLFNWCVNQTKGYKNVHIRNFTSSWKSGLGFCAILHKYGPDYIDYDTLNPDDIFKNCELAFNVAEKYFGIPSLLSSKDMVNMKIPDRLCIITYLSQYYNTLSTKPPKTKNHNTGFLNAIENVDKEVKIVEEKNVGEEETENNPSQSNDISDNEKCAICSKSIYFLEKLTVSDIFYHRSCYRQNQLTNLKTRNKTLERPSKPVTDTLHESNSNGDKNFTTVVERTSRSRLSPSIKAPLIAKKPSRPPSLDNYLADEKDKKSSPIKTDDHSSQSASSVNFVSVNASSMESLSQNNSEVPKPTDKSVKLYSNKLHPSSLDNSVNSLNSSFSKKRHAPPPPTVKPRSTLLNTNKQERPVSQEKPALEYPEELNPFAEEETLKKPIAFSHDDLNPFAEYMTDDTPKPVDKPTIKSRKRLAPKLPLKTSQVDINQSKESIFNQDLSKDEIGNSSTIHVDNIESTYENFPINNNFLSNNLPKEERGDLMIYENLPINNNIDDAKQYDNQKSVDLNTTATNTKLEQNSNETSPSKSVESILSSPAHSEYNSEEIATESIISSPEKSTEEKYITQKLNRVTIDSDNQTSTSTIKSFVPPDNKLRKKRLETLCKSQDSLNDSMFSRSFANKPPAPARPPPPKREVRADTSYEFIPYEYLYKQLKELNESQSKIEAEGRDLQDQLWKADQNQDKFEEMLQAWLDLVEKKNILYSREADLHEILKRQELEDRHSDLEYELRLLMGKQESQKTATEKAREEELIGQILDTVNARAQLIDKADEELRQNPINEDRKSKNTLKSFFSMKRRSSSVGKINPSRSRTFNIGKKKKPLNAFTLRML